MYQIRIRMVHRHMGYYLWLFMIQTACLIPHPGDSGKKEKGEKD